MLFRNYIPILHKLYTIIGYSQGYLDYLKPLQVTSYKKRRLPHKTGGNPRRQNLFLNIFLDKSAIK